MMIETPRRIMCAGDWHGNWLYAVSVVEYAASNGVDVIVQVGDFGWWTPGGERKLFLNRVHQALVDHDITLYWLDGNHEDHADLANFIPEDRTPWAPRKYPRIIHLPRGFRWEWWGKTWMALGGAHSVDKGDRTPGKSWWPQEFLSDDDVAHASRDGKVDVLVAHDCPSGVNIPGLNPLDWPVVQIRQAEIHRDLLRQVVDKTKPSMIIHGHYHVSYWGGMHYADGSSAIIRGLDRDGAHAGAHTLFLNEKDHDLQDDPG